MTWIQYLENNNIPFNLYILEPDDSLLINIYSQNSYLIFIPEGLVQLLKIFTNHEILCQQLLYRNEIFVSFNNNYKAQLNYYCRATAITKTILLSISFTNFQTNPIIQEITIQQVQAIYKYQFQQRTTILQILCHRNTKKRIKQLLLILAKYVGQYDKNNIIIPFHISHYTISNIVGSQRTSVTRIMRSFKTQGIISYNYQKIIIYKVLRLMQ